MQRVTRAAFPSSGGPPRRAGRGVRLAWAWLAAGSVFVAMVVAAAPAGAYGGVSAATSHPAVERVEQLLARAGVDGAVVETPLRNARQALGRARAAREAQDPAHGAQLERLAVEWAGMAHATVRAVRSEASAQSRAGRLRELHTKVERARALLTELQARRGRLQAEVDRAEQAAEQRRRGATRSEAKRLERARRGQQRGPGARRAKPVGSAQRGRQP